MFLIFIFDLEYLIRVQSSEPLYAKKPPACSGSRSALSSYWLAHFHLMKKSAKVQLDFGLRNDGIFYLRAAIQRTGGLERSFCMKRLRTLKLFNIQDKNLKIKNT
jgi:hypothetical protein